jgi:hypothetical protein
MCSTILAFLGFLRQPPEADRYQLTEGLSITSRASENDFVARQKSGGLVDTACIRESAGWIAR